ncbi:hypothetical protein ABZ858_24265 [Streptomyces sp. NPDC047017]|uniref:hypothetical protein n=1 Tax=Streptomyces sp. NPDC047017 TaxID=3155024 RepID=UPI0033E3526D
MFLVQLHVTGSAEPASGPADAHALQDLLWAHAAPRHRLEHVRARCLFDGIGVVLFISAPTSDRAAAQAADLLADASDSGLLARYRITGI